MIVELKKVKLTGSIIKQIVYAGPHQMAKYDVLGWIIVTEKGSKYKRIILYDSATNSLAYVYYPNTMEIRQNAAPTFYVAYISDRGLLQYNDSQYNTKEDMQKLLDVMVAMRDKAKIKGQIFY